MNSPLFKDWVSEERREATKNNSKETIIFLLETKFDLVPSTINEQIQGIDDLSILKGLTKKVLTVSSINEFEALLNEAKKLSS